MTRGVADRGGAGVVVVGAGVAGLAAARTLAEAGLEPLVLEARTRIGGRAHTVTDAAGPLDLGCEWLHSGDRNPLTAVAEQLGHVVERARSPWGQADSFGFGEAEQAAYEIASEAFYDRLEAQAATGRDVPATAVLEAGDRWNPLMDAVSSYINGVEFDGLSVVDYARYANSGVNWRLRQGYGALIAAYGASVPVRFDCPVTVLDHGGTRLRLTTPRGAVEADRVIVTVPSTLLAEGALRFRPELPAKRDAAAGLPLGVANKLFLAVDDPRLMPRESHLFGRIDRVGTGSYHLRPLGRPCIECYYGGALATDLERGGRDAFTDFALEELARHLGADIRRHLRPLASTAWVADPWSRGSYSHALPGHADDRAVLAAPVDGRLFFAGEACSRHDFSTAHGAYRTGVAAAGAVLAAIAGADADDRPVQTAAR